MDKLAYGDQLENHYMPVFRMFKSTYKCLIW